MTESFFAHHSAVVDAGARVGEGTKIWHFCHVMSGAMIGKNCILGQNVFVGSGVKVGDGVKIQNNVSLYDGVEIENDVFLGPSCVFTNVINPRAWIDRKDAFAKTFVGRGVTIGANATIICGVRVGRFALIGAGAVVTSDVSPHALIIGVPGRRKGWACGCGCTLRQEEGERFRCDECGKIYQLSANHPESEERSLSDHADFS